MNDYSRNGKKDECDKNNKRKRSIVVFKYIDKAVSSSNNTCGTCEKKLNTFIYLVIKSTSNLSLENPLIVVVLELDLP